MGTGIPGISIFEVIFHRPSLKREPANETETKIKIYTFDFSFSF
jgi:hypothetical protein